MYLDPKGLLSASWAVATSLSSSSVDFLHDGPKDKTCEIWAHGVRGVRALLFECCSFDENVLELVSNTVILKVFEGYDSNSRASRSNTRTPTLEYRYFFHFFDVRWTV